MGTRRCMNSACGVAEPGGGGGEWKKGWALRSGGFASLCTHCGMAYDQSVFCEIFHMKESGWRECNTCGKRLHCGCIASKSAVELLDGGGVRCISCMKNSELPSNSNDVGREVFLQTCSRIPRVHSLSPGNEKGGSIGGFAIAPSLKLQHSLGDDFVEKDAYSKAQAKAFQLGSTMDGNGHNSILLAQQSPSLVGSSMRLSNRIEGMPNTSLTPNASDSEVKDQSKALATSQLGHRAHQFLPMSPKMGDSPTSESKSILPHTRIARPPSEGRGRNQLLPRYWPRITEQELQQISGNSNSTIVPLFEKVLSASDAGRIGRLVLPKACAEAYFPPISQPEGLPLTIQDSKGKDWHFQFRFWPNNNSRMYVLEGVTPCIQSLQLQAGDTVTFSRIDPEGKLVMGFRKATNSVPLQDSQIAAIANGALGSESFLSSVNDNLPFISGYSACRPLKVNGDPQSSSLSEHLSSTDRMISWNKIEKHTGRSVEGLSLPLTLSERRRNRNSVPRSKRLHMDSEDALELKLTWEEAQDLLRPPPSAKPSIVMIDDHEFEEYEGQDQWIQCDDCLKWRRILVDTLVPSKWKCADNIWDPNRSSCSVPGELSPNEIQDLLFQNSDLKRRKISESIKYNTTESEASGLDALAAAATLGDFGNQITPSSATTTKHPRHRPGCTCIVCIQPPSGKGPKHSPSCTCNVCLTVKRRFKTLMMRKKQRQSELEEAEAQKKLPWVCKEEPEGSSPSKSFQPSDSQKESELVLSETSKGRIDLNFGPGRDLDPNAGSRMSMVNLLKVASRPLDAYLHQNGLKSLTLEQEVSPSSQTAAQATPESEGITPEESCIAPIVEEQENGGDENCESENVDSEAA